MVPSLKSYLYAVRLRGTERIVPVLVFKTTRDVKAGDELTYVYAASFDPEPTLLAMPSCEDLSLYLKRMPHLDPDSVFGSYAGFWQSLVTLEERRRQRNEAARLRDLAEKRLLDLRKAERDAHSRG